MPNDDVFTMPLATLEQRAEQVMALLEQVDDLLPGLIELTEDAKGNSIGNYRDGEAEALSTVLDVAAKEPALFKGLADKDGGEDPKVFEGGLIRDRLDRAIILGAVIAKAKDLIGPLSDTRLHLGNQTRPVLLAMYEIVKPQAKNDVTIAATAKKALDFFSAIGKAAAATRARKKKGEK